MTSGIKVLHIETGRHFAGGPQQVLTLMKGLKTLGVDSTILCPDDSAIAELAEQAEFDVKRVPYKGEHDFSLIKAIKIVAQEGYFDLLHAHSRRGADNYTAIVARRTKIPAILTRRVINLENGLIAGPKYRSFKKVVAVSEAVERSLKRQRVDANLRHVIHDGIILQDYIKQHSRADLLAEFDLPNDAVVIGNVGRFTANKGQLSLLEAFNKLIPKHDNLHLVLFGKGEMLDDLLDYVADNNLKDKVHFAGFRLDMPMWYSSLDMLVHTAKREALSVALLEASACGLPLIAYNNGGVSEVIRHVYNGLLVQPEKTDQLADAIERIATNPKMGISMGKAAKINCQKFFTADVMINKYHELYEQVIADLE